MSLRYRKDDPYKEFKKALMKALEDSEMGDDLWFPQQHDDQIIISWRDYSKSKRGRVRRVSLSIHGMSRGVQKRGSPINSEMQGKEYCDLHISNTKRQRYLELKGLNNLEPEELIELEKLSNWCYSCLDNLNHCKHSQTKLNIPSVFRFDLTREEVEKHIRSCEGIHRQQVAYSTYHQALTQICFNCRVVRSQLSEEEN